MRMERLHHLALIADDDFFVRAMLSRMLNDKCHVVEVQDGANLLEVYKQHMPDVVFLDVHLPHMNGIDLIAKIKRVDPEAYIIMLTADSTEENIKRSISNGASGFVSKPFQPRTIMANLQRCPFMAPQDLVT